MNRIAKTLLPALAIVAAGAWRTGSDPVTLRPESKLWVDGTSSVKSFTCKAAAMSVTAEASSAPVAALFAGTKPFKTVRFEVQTARLDCSNGTMNEHMLKALKARDYPVISFQIDGYDLRKSADTTQGVLTGTLAIGGVEQVVTFPVVLGDAGKGVLRVTGRYELNMKEYGIKPPSLMMGTMRVRERVKVGFDLLLK